MLSPYVLRTCVAACLAAVMSARGYRKGALSRSGAIASAVTGLLHMSISWTFGFVLIAFYLSSSRLTKLKQVRKSVLDAHFKLNGQRSATQVVSSSAGGSIAAVVAAAAPLLAGNKEQALTLQLVAWMAFLGHYACCCGDTWASELGLAYSRSPPRLITTLQTVPFGVNGAVSGLGLAASAVGGALMGAVLAAVAWLTGELQPLLEALDGMMRGTHGWPAGPQQQQLGWWPPGRHAFVLGVVLGLSAGLAGSLADSLLGATLQYSGYCQKTNRVVGRPGPHVSHISGADWLSNEAVNAAAAAMTALVAAAGTWWAVGNFGAL